MSQLARRRRITKSALSRAFPTAVPTPRPLVSSHPSYPLFCLLLPSYAFLAMWHRLQSVRKMVSEESLSHGCGTARPDPTPRTRVPSHTSYPLFCLLMHSYALLAMWYRLGSVERTRGFRIECGMTGRGGTPDRSQAPPVKPHQQVNGQTKS